VRSEVQGMGEAEPSMAAISLRPQAVEAPLLPFPGEKRLERSVARRISAAWRSTTRDRVVRLDEPGDRRHRRGIIGHGAERQATGEQQPRASSRSRLSIP
jgi:hypothetical protein